MTRLRRTLASAVLVLLAAGGCTRAEAADDGLDVTASVSVDQSLRALLPQYARDRGFVRMVTDASYAPMEYFAADGRTIIGFEPDLAAALGSVLGIRIELVQGDFAGSLDAVAAGSYDGVFSSMTDTREREAKADFVDYFSTGTSIVVQRGNPLKITDLDGLCGKKVGTEIGTYQEGMLRRHQSGCGAKPMTIVALKTNADALLRLRTGRVAAVPIDYPAASHVALDPETNAFYELASAEQYEPGLFGIAVAKGGDGLRDALRGALERLITTGAYADLLKRWCLEPGAVTKATVNAGD
ncbi:ABC transporter substrate-binding protein [Actinoplanes sp. NPDC051851]|uniref:ABC transporter substrate-binding protein n=1 Tax=Actinoplanes sp. NPDC051851 TaxID=3154753 RepID=UPI003430A114